MIYPIDSTIMGRITKFTNFFSSFTIKEDSPSVCTTRYKFVSIWRKFDSINKLRMLLRMIKMNINIYLKFYCYNNSIAVYYINLKFQFKGWSGMEWDWPIFSTRCNSEWPWWLKVSAIHWPYMTSDYTNTCSSIPSKGACISYQSNYINKLRLITVDSNW